MKAANTAIAKNFILKIITYDEIFNLNTPNESNQVEREIQIMKDFLFSFDCFLVLFVLS